MTQVIFILLFVVSIKAIPYPDASVIVKDTTSDIFSNDINILPDEKKNKEKKLNNTKDNKNKDNHNNSNSNSTLKSQEMQVRHNGTKGKKNRRLHKAFFLNQHYVPPTHQYSPPFTFDNNNNNKNNKNYLEEKHLGHWKHNQNSKIFYVRLPPTPYFFVPGLGYISNPPKFSTNSLKPYQSLNINNNGHKNTLINLPIDFISNGKPTSVYQWNKNHKPTKKPINSMNKMKKGPYGFNGKPTSIYLLDANGEKRMHQPIIYADAVGNEIS